MYNYVHNLFAEKEKSVTLFRLNENNVGPGVPAELLVPPHIVPRPSPLAFGNIYTSWILTHSKEVTTLEKAHIYKGNTRPGI